MASVCSRVNAQRPDESTNSFFEALYQEKDAEAHQIIEGLYLGSNKAAQDRKAMQKRGVTHALIVHPGIPEPHPQHFKYRRSALADEPTANLLEVLPDALEFLGLARKRGTAFVFCMKGISRSSSVVISFLMVEKGLGFEEAWKVCEQKRPIVYPNIGFQQQLRHLETLLSGIAANEPWEKRLNHLRSVVPQGDLGAPSSPFRVRDLIGESMSAAFDEVEALAERIFSQPQLLQKREQWKRHGLYFENLHKYKTLPSDIALVSRARAVSAKLASLPKVFSDSLKGVKLALAVANQIQSWIVFAEPMLQKEEEECKEREAENNDAPPELKGLEAFDELMAARRDMDEDIASDKVKKSKGNEKKEKGKDKKKKSKKDKKKKKKDKKKLKEQDKKSKKAAKKAEKDAEKIENLARDAELAALEAGEEAERIADAARRAEEELAKLESDEALDAAEAAADAAAEARANFAKSVGLARKSDSSSGSDSASGSESDSEPQQKRARK